MTKEKMRQVLTRIYGPDVEFTKSVTGREGATVPLSDDEKAMVAPQMSVATLSPTTGLYERDEALTRQKIDEVRHCVAAKNIMTGEWEFTRDVRETLQDVMVDTIMNR